MWGNKRPEEPGEAQTPAERASAEERAQILNQPILTVAQKKEELRRLENELAKGKRSWVKEGRALAEIKGRELYVVTAGTWEDFLRAWAYRPTQARAMMRCASLVEPNIREVRHALSLRAASRLARLPADKQEICLREAITDTGCLGPSAEAISAAIAKLFPELIRPPRTIKKPSKSRKLRFDLPSGSIRSTGRGSFAVRLKSGAGLLSLAQELSAKLSSTPQADAA